MQRIVPLLWPLGFALGLTAEWVGPGFGNPRQWIPDLAVGWTFIVCGLVAATRRTESRSGVLMTATGFAWFIGNFADVRFEAVAWLAAQGTFIYRGPLVHLILAYPTGRVTTRLTRAAVLTGYTAAFLAPVWANEPATIVLAVLLVAVSAFEYLRAVGRDRRARALPVLAAAALALVLAGGAVARGALPPGDVSVPSLLANAIVLCSIAAGLLAGLIAAPWDRPAITDLVVELGEVRAATLRGRLAQALGDPSLEVGYWLEETGAFVDSEGHTLSLPAADPTRSVTLVQRDGRPVAVLVHDPAVLGEPGLVDAVASAARLAASNARLHAEVEAQVAELAASRRRILEAGDEEGRRLEQRLRDGAGLRLVELGRTLRRSRSDASVERTREQIAHAERELERTSDDLRRLAHGLYPRILSERGLQAALAPLAQASPVPVKIEVTSRPIPPRVMEAAYFVCAEGLVNAAKYAAASRVTVAVALDDDWITVTVEDDGVGGVDPSRGSGIRGLADRIETLGGAFRIDSPVGHGTHLAAEIPLGGKAV